MRIVIIGAGIGGLVAAAALQRDGHAVTILEQRPQAGAIGAGISLFANTFAALGSVGLTDIITPLTQSDSTAFRAGQRTPNGRWLVTLPRKAIASMRVLHRIDLHNALAEFLEPGILHSGCEASIDPADATPTNQLPAIAVASTIAGEAADPIAGSRATFDLVIAADGIQSRIRETLGLDTGLRYSGYTAWRGVTATPFDVRGEAGETWGLGRRFGVAPLPDGRVYWFATDNLPENSKFDNEKNAVLDRFDSWHSPIRELVEATDANAVNRHDIYDLTAPLSSFVRGRVVLLGDAAHAMTPDLGQGAGQAIEDAATLTLMLRGKKSPEDIDAALVAYDRLRRARSQRIASRSRRMGKFAQCASPFQVRVRNGLLKLTPNFIVGAAASRVQNWKPPRTR